MTERRLPAVVLGGLNAGGDEAIHDPLLHPELYEGVVIRRIAAFCLDMLLIGVVLTIGWVVAITVLVFSFFLIALPMAAASLILLVLYDVLTIGGPSSATPGMRAFGLKVITWTGSRPDNVQAFLMSALFWAIHFFTGWLIAAVALLNPRWRNAHDFLAGTVVVRSDPRPRLT